MRWSQLHGDMQEIASKEVRFRSDGPAERPCLNKTISEIPCRVSSDLHEWSNDLGAVSSRDPVKL
jgi:hypothetical protein